MYAPVHILRQSFILYLTGKDPLIKDHNEGLGREMETALQKSRSNKIRYDAGNAIQAWKMGELLA